MTARRQGTEWCPCTLPSPFPTVPRLREQHPGKQAVAITAVIQRLLRRDTFPHTSRRQAGQQGWRTLMAGVEWESRRRGQEKEKAMVQHARAAVSRERCGASPANDVVVGLLPYVHGRLAKKPPFWMDGRRTSGPPSSSLRPPAHIYPREELDSPLFPSTGAAGSLTVRVSSRPDEVPSEESHTTRTVVAPRHTGKRAVLFLQNRKVPPFPSLEVVLTPGWFIHQFPLFNTSHHLSV